uniref:GP-PDE domain-containing protein n=1 Tax=Timema poppense TaxID=170557 RepID=A0A7R9CR16_TIMPO|nr:unnamed protein product [Timema poppensis]
MLNLMRNKHLPVQLELQLCGCKVPTRILGGPLVLDQVLNVLTLVIHRRFHRDLATLIVSIYLCNKALLNTRRGNVKVPQPWDTCEIKTHSFYAFMNISAHEASIMTPASVAYLANTLVVLSSTAEDGEIEVRISVGSPMASLVLTDNSQLTADGFEKLPDQIRYPYAEPYDWQKHVFSSCHF